MVGVLDHLAAGLGTVTTGLGTGCHVLVVGEFFARLAAGITGLGAGVAEGGCQRPGPPGQLACRSADRPAVVAQVHRLDVVLLAVSDEMGAVVEAGVALAGAV